MKHVKYLGFLLGLLWAAHGLALSTDRDQPLQIQADRASIDDLRGMTVYEGKVVVAQGSMRLEADKVTVTYDADRKLENIVAEGGPAHFRQRPDNRDEDIHARAKRMEYYVKQDMLHLITKAEVWQGKDSFKGEHIVYDQKRSLITAKDRVSVVIEPKTAQQKVP